MEPSVLVPAVLVPAADSLPAAPWLFRVLLDATFGLHLLLLNAMLGLTFLGFVRSFRSGPGGGAPGLAQQAGLVPILTALAVNLGVAPLLFIQALHGQFFYVSATLMAVYWFALVLAVMAAYALAYWQKHVFHAAGGAGPGSTALAWALMAVLMLYAAFAQTSNALLLIRPDLWQGYWDNPSGTLTAWGDPTFIPRMMHFVTASVAVGGVSLAIMGRFRSKRRDPGGAALTEEGLAWFGWATLVQMAFGLWWLMSLPEPLRLAFLGGDRAASALLVAGLTGAGSILAFAFRRRLVPALAALAFTASVMVTMRGVLRQLYLAPHFDQEKLPVSPEPSTLAMFLGSLALSLAVVVWAARHPKADPSEAKGA